MIQKHWCYTRFVCLFMVFMLLIAIPFSFLPGKAATVPQTLKVYAQYWADPDSAVLLKEFSRDELEALSNSEIGYEGYYCNVTNVNTVMRIHARGFKLAEFLSGPVGLDLNSIRQLDFHTTDVASDVRFVSKGREELLDTPHYYYPYLIPNSHMDEELDERVIDDGEAASVDAVEVPTIIAVEQYSTKRPKDDLSGEMTADTSFRLCAGHPDAELITGNYLTKTSFESAKWVDEIYVVLAGAPPEPSTNPEPSTEPDESPTGSSDLTPVPDPEPSTDLEPSTDPEPSTEPQPSIGPSENPNGGGNTPSGTDRVPVPTQTPNRTNPPGSTAKPVSPAKNGSTVKPRSTLRSTTRVYSTTRRIQRPGTTAATRAQTQTRRNTMTTRAQSRIDLSESRTDSPTAINTNQMERIEVDGYDSLIKWKENSPNVTALQKPLVTTTGVRNAVLLFILSFALGAGIMYKWFKEEQ